MKSTLAKLASRVLTTAHVNTLRKSLTGLGRLVEDIDLRVEQRRFDLNQMKSVSNEALLNFDMKLQSISELMVKQATTLDGYKRTLQSHSHATYDFNIIGVVSFYLREQDPEFCEDSDNIIASVELILSEAEDRARYRDMHYTGISCLLFDALNCGHLLQKLKKSHIPRVGMMHLDVELVCQSAFYQSCSHGAKV